MDCVDCNNDGEADDGSHDFDDCHLSSNPSSNPTFDTRGHANIEVVWLEMRTDQFRQNENLLGTGEGAAELYFWSSTFDLQLMGYVKRKVGIPCVQETQRQYAVNAKIGAVGPGQSIRVGVWEWDDVTQWTDDSLGDRWIFPEDFAEKDEIDLIFDHSMWRLRCTGCSTFSGTPPVDVSALFISEDPEYTKTTEDFLETMNPENPADNDLLGLWNYDYTALRATETIELYSYTHEDSTAHTTDDERYSETSSETFAFTAECENCYIGVTDGELIVDYVTSLTQGFQMVAAEVSAEFKLNVDLLLSLKGSYTHESSTRILDKNCLYPACIDFDMLGVTFKLGYMTTLDFETMATINLEEMTINPGFDMTWQVGVVR
eukprot:gene7787-9252_t